MHVYWGKNEGYDELRGVIVKLQKVECEGCDDECDDREWCELWCKWMSDVNNGIINMVTMNWLNFVNKWSWIQVKMVRALYRAVNGENLKGKWECEL